MSCRDHKPRARSSSPGRLFAAPLLGLLLLFGLAAAAVRRASGSSPLHQLRRLAAATPAEAAATGELAGLAAAGEELSFSRFRRAAAAQLAAAAASAAGRQAGTAAAVDELAARLPGCRPNLVVVLTSHKTGTAQAR